MILAFFIEEKASILISEFILSKRYDYKIGNYKLSEMISDINSDEDDEDDADEVLEDRYEGQPHNLFHELFEMISGKTYMEGFVPDNLKENDFSKIDDDVSEVVNYYLSSFWPDMFLEEE